MIVSLLGKWKQLIDFHFTGRSFDAKIIAKWLKEIIEELVDASLDVSSMCMDMGALNMGVWKEFQIMVNGSPTQGYTVSFKFIFANCIINVLFDVPHIIKAIRNATMRQILYIT